MWTIVAALGAGGVYAAYRYTGTTEIDVAVARVRRGDFIVSVKTRGDVRSTHSVLLTAPQVPEPRIVKLAESGKPVKKGDVVIEFDGVQQEQNYIEKSTNVRTADSEIVQTKAQHKIEDEMDGMNLMQSEYNVQRAKLEASKAEILSEIEGAKNRIDVGVSEGELGQVKTTIESRKISQSADVERLDQKKVKAVRDTDLAKSYLSKMVVRAPNDGIVNVLPNFRAGGSFGQSPPPVQGGRPRVDRRRDCGNSRSRGDARRAEARRSGPRQAEARPGRPCSRGCDSGKGIQGGNGLDQSYRPARVPDISSGKALPCPGHAQESRPASQTRHERDGRDHRRKAAERPAHSIARKFSG